LEKVLIQTKRLEEEGVMALHVGFVRRNNRSPVQAYITHHILPEALQVELTENESGLRVVDFITINSDLGYALEAMCKFDEVKGELENLLARLYNIKKRRRRPLRHSSK
jgi:hypothetical protein